MTKLLSIPKDWSKFSDDEVKRWIEYIKDNFDLFEAKKVGNIVTLSHRDNIVKINKYAFDYTINGKKITQGSLWNIANDFYCYYCWKRITFGKSDQTDVVVITATTFIVGVCILWFLSSNVFRGTTNFTTHRQELSQKYEKARVAANSQDTCVYGRNIER